MQNWWSLLIKLQTGWNVLCHPWIFVNVCQHSSVWWMVMIHRSIPCLKLLQSQEKHHHFSVAYLFSLLAIHIWWVMSTIYPGCIAWEITAPSGATQIGYPGYWELLSLRSLICKECQPKRVLIYTKEWLWIYQ